MRNASDIFFLKEDDNRAGNIFSVNGACPMKIRRRRKTNTSNDCFEYGRAKCEFVEEKLAESLTDNQELVHIGDHLESIDKNDESELNEEMRKIKIDETEKRIEIDSKTTSGPSFSASNMSRNILTGAGMEIVEHRKPKKGTSRNEKGLW